MLFSDIGKMYLGDEQVKKIYLGDNLLWPTTTDYTFEGFLMYDGTVLHNNGKMYLMEHNCSKPIWLKTNAPADAISARVTGAYASKYSITHVSDNFFIIKDEDPYNDNVQYSGVIEFSIGENIYKLNVTTCIEVQGDNIEYNENANVCMVEEIPATGYNTTRIFNPGEAWNNPGLPASTSMTPYPVETSGNTARCYKYENGTISLVNCSDVTIRTAFDGMSYETLDSTINRDFLSINANINIPANNSGHIKYYVLELYNPDWVYHCPFPGTYRTTTLVFYQKSA